MKTLSAGVAFVLLLVALVPSPDQVRPWTVLAVLAALALSLLGACAGAAGRGRWTRFTAAGLLVLVVAAELVWLCRLLTNRPLPDAAAHVLYLQPRVLDGLPPLPLPGVLSRPAVLVAAALVLVVLGYAWQWPGIANARVVAFFAAYTALGACVIRATPRPLIDVWHLQQEAAAHLLHGEDPYAAEYGNPYGDERFFDPRTLHDGRVFSFPYPPLSLLLAVPGYLAGDVRWSLLAAVVGTGALVVATGRRLGLRPGHPAELAAVALLCHPRVLYVLQMGWTEPFEALSVAFTVWALAAARPRVAVVGLAAALSAKQYGFLIVPALWASRRVGWRSVVLAGTLAALLAMPFLLWDVHAFFRGNVAFHLYSPFRDDCVSVPALVAVRTGYHLQPVLGFVAAALAALVVVWRSGNGLASTVLGSAAMFLAFFAFNKAAHLNYYWLVCALLALGVVVAFGEGGEGDMGTPRRAS